MRVPQCAVGAGSATAGPDAKYTNVTVTQHLDSFADVTVIHQ